MKKNRISIARRRGTELTDAELAAIRDGCNAVLMELFPGLLCAVGVTVCMEAEIRRVNAEERGIDAVTDVLSFPMLELAPGQSPAEVAEEPDYEDGRIYLGDMLLCAPRAREQAREYGHSVRREFAFLAAHSVLHFLGYVHMEDAERAEMEAVQRTALEHAGSTREI